MKLITWNCCRAFKKKYIHLLRYDPDLLIIPECEKSDESDTKFYHQDIWVGNNSNKGLGVFSFNDIDIKIHDSYRDDFRYIVPIEIINPKSQRKVNLIAIWSQNNKEDLNRRYIGEVWGALDYYKDILKSPVIIAGDFNWNIRMDNDYDAPLNGTFADVRDLLERHNIHSMYHTYNNLDFGDEKDPTFFLTFNEQKPYHTDYMFASAEIIKNMKSFSVGKYADWRPLKSDHMPLMAELGGI
jgi:exonuclease III